MDDNNYDLYTEEELEVLDLEDGPYCGLCGFPIGQECDGTEASHDGDGMEPCEYGHYACSMNGSTGGPCSNEHQSLKEND